MPREPEAYVVDNLFEIGIGEVIVCRFKGDGRAEVGVFLVDVFCLGVKNAFFQLFPSEEEFRAEYLGSKMSPVSPHPAAYGRKLVEDAVRYAQSLGISPHSDYKKAARVFGGINAADCKETFVFGKDGRPALIEGPNDDPEIFDRIHTTLRIRLGEDGFDLIEADGFDNESKIIFIAIDSMADGEEPSPELEDFAEEFLDENSDIFDDVIYGSPSDASIAALFLSSAKEMHAAVQTTEAEAPLALTLSYLQNIWNLRNLPDEERTRTLEQFPEEVRDFMRGEAEALPISENPIMILAFRHLHPGEPGRERLLMLCEPT